jgi:hypothetical protein
MDAFFAVTSGPAVWRPACIPAAVEARQGGVAPSGSGRPEKAVLRRR